MIAVDTSALIAILFDEPEAPICQDAMERADRLAISAATVTEALIVASKRGVTSGLEIMLENLDIEVVDVTSAFARRAAAAHHCWGKGRHKASLNYGDSFSYALAEMRQCPLLYVGNDFAQTDIVSAIA